MAPCAAKRSQLRDEVRDHRQPFQHTGQVRDLVIIRNPDPDSRLPYLVRLPLGGDGRTLRTAGNWPREKAIYCYPAAAEEWTYRFLAAAHP